ncbi:aliphatic sulfonate ABC transporter permease SsuC [Peribacillus frigoritolerans]|uniref:Aliphatic sulfonate ABC transporter permease SsuC n=1 Tax=Peribacillus frigoritolerans TaxID=450367 RepID=A0AAJ1VC54_9BACI|nr:aliphatic sulfonate ABC transporter permease SsuC [Peribacillus frigoritolerans]MDM5281908.1 aliphatic sulfonate ABC transporter permease SsuC [Peribacillus frigoritolerans]
MKKKRFRAYHQAAPWIIPILLLISWQVFSVTGWISGKVLPSPLDVIKAGLSLTVNGELFTNIWVSFTRAFIGFVIGGGIGLILGLLNGIYPVAERHLDTTIQMLRNIPHLALIPIVILWFGVGEEAKIFLVLIGVFFPIYINTYHGIRSIDKGLIEMGEVYGLSRWKLFSKLIFPGALPSILVGFRYALGIMWLTLIVAETVAASSGIGYMAMNAREFMQLDIVVLAIILYAFLGKLADSLAKLLEWHLLKWNSVYQKK